MRILIFGDIPEIPQLLRHLPIEHLVGIVCATIRAQYHTALSAIADGITGLNVGGRYVC